MPDALRRAGTDRLPDLGGRALLPVHLVARREAPGLHPVAHRRLQAARASTAEASCSSSARPGYGPQVPADGPRHLRRPADPLPEGVLVPMVALVGDQERLRRSGSALYPVLRGLERDGLHLPTTRSRPSSRCRTTPTTR
ncbi:MAG: hypothetical protein R3F59_08440 [Myxococcota bacterium]